MSPQNIATICSYFKSSCRTNSEDQFTNCSIERCLGRVRSIRSLGISVTKKKNLLTRSIFKSNLHLSHFCAQFHCWEWYRTKCMSNLGNGNTFLPIFFFFFLSESIYGIFFFKVVFFLQNERKNSARFEGHFLHTFLAQKIDQKISSQTLPFCDRLIQNIPNESILCWADLNR